MEMPMDNSPSYEQLQGDCIETVRLLENVRNGVKEITNDILNKCFKDGLFHNLHQEEIRKYCKQLRNL